MPTLSKLKALGIEPVESVDLERATLYLEALAAAAALIASADGAVHSRERQQYFSAARSSRLLAAFSAEEIQSEFTLFLRTLERDVDAALQLAEDRISPLKVHPDLATALLEECRRMIVADDRAFPTEIGALHRIRAYLGLGATSEAVAPKGFIRFYRVPLG